MQNIHGRPEEKRYDIGGEFTLVLAKVRGGFIGEYKRKGSKQTYMFDGSGMTKKQILTIFWDKVRKMQKLQKSS